jgi:hypothetical protein
MAAEPRSSPRIRAEAVAPRSVAVALELAETRPTTIRNSPIWPRRNNIRHTAECGQTKRTPLHPDQAEHVDAQTLRTSMAALGDPITKNLCEAETVAIMTRRRIDGLFLTDDRDAQPLAQQLGITAVTTWDLLRLAYRTNKTTKPVLAGYLRTLTAKTGTPTGRHQPRRPRYLARLNGISRVARVPIRTHPGARST